MIRYGLYQVLTRPDGTLWQLGAGSMGITYKARDERRGLPVALKVISPALRNDPTSEALFLREARLAARIREAHVARVLTVDDTPGAPFYAMEFVPGVTLAEFLRTRGRLCLALALDLAEQIMEALAAVHAAGLIHRDLKPANLMILSDPAAAVAEAERWLVKVIDFGLARSTGTDASEEGLLPAGGFRGTALYASPEQCGEHDVIDGRADQYAVGCVLWEMLAGQPPFHAFTRHELLLLHLGSPLCLERLCGLPTSVQTLLTRLLAKDPADRFRDARAAVAAMRQLRSALTPEEGSILLPPTPDQAETAQAAAETTVERPVVPLAPSGLLPARSTVEK